MGISQPSFLTEILAWTRPYKLKAEQLAGEMATQATTLDDLNGLMRTMMKSALERMLDTEMDVHLGRRDHPGRWPPTSPSRRDDRAARRPPRTAATDIPRRPSSGDLGELTPRHAARPQRHLRAAADRQAPTPAHRLRREDPGPVRQGHDHPRHPGRRQGTLRRGGVADAGLGDHRRPRRRSDGLAARGGSMRSGRSSTSTASWCMCAARTAGCRSTRCTWPSGVNLQGKKELLGLWLSETEGAKFWLSCLTDLKNRGLNDIFVACVDGLTGFPEAIRTAYPADEGAAVHRAPGAGGLEVRDRQGQSGGGGRPEDDLPSRRR